jgi:tryptophan halogenase
MKKITVVGGGTAGWLAILHFIRFVPNQYKICIIESENIATIGAGEGTTGLFSDFINFDAPSIGHSVTNFINETGATPKLAIRFEDWKGDGSDYISPIMSGPTSGYEQDDAFLQSIINGDTMNATSSFFGYMAENDLSTFRTDYITTDQTHAYHFDANKVATYFRKISLKANIEYINSEIVTVNKNSISGDVMSVTLTDGTEHFSDIWIDCTGFHRVLIKEMDSKWISYQKYLPMNTALPYTRLYDKNEIVKPETIAWAQNNGWMWQIPTRDRIGAGYVFCDGFTNADNALKELNERIGREVTPIRTLKFDSGRTDKFWVKNVLSVGLCSVFTEPLQATSIHSTLVQLFKITFEILRPENFEWHDKYNTTIGSIFDDYVDFIQLHYKSNREDTEFWKFVKNELTWTDKVKEITEMCNHRVPKPYDFNEYFGAAGWGAWQYTISGLGLISKELALKELNGRTYNLDKLNKEWEEVCVRYIKNSELIKQLQKTPLG